MTLPIEVIEETKRAQALLQPARLALLERLETPRSAAALARELDLPRQRVNYHLRELESQRLVELVEERRRGNAVERFYRRTGQAYAISEATLGPLSANTEDIQDRFSAAYQIALASRSIRELARLQRGANAAGKRLPTFALEVEVRFASADKRNQFAEELTNAVAELVRKHHDDTAPDGRVFRFQLGAYPKPLEAQDGGATPAS